MKRQRTVHACALKRSHGGNEIPPRNRKSEPGNLHLIEATGIGVGSGDILASLLGVLQRYGQLVEEMVTFTQTDG